MTLGARVGVRTGWSRKSGQERLVYRLLLPVFGTVFVLATIPFVMAVIEATTAGAKGFLGGLGIALLVHRVIRSAALRAAIYVAAMLPIVIPQIAVGVVFRLVYQPDYGILNVLLGRTGADQLLWLSSPPLALIATASVDIWQWTPFVYLVMFAGLQTVPSESVEAAQVDGASSWMQFRHIELPYLRPLLLLVVFFRLADVVRVFDHVYVLTGGGPGTTTQYLSLYIYRIGFQFTDLSQASALAVVVMATMTIFYTIISRFLPADRG